MVSSTRQTERRRYIRARSQGATNKATATPKFPVHQEGYDPKAPDAPVKPKA